MLWSVKVSTNHFCVCSSRESGDVSLKDPKEALRDPRPAPPLLGCEELQLAPLCCSPPSFSSISRRDFSACSRHSMRVAILGCASTAVSSATTARAAVRRPLAWTRRRSTEDFCALSVPSSRRLQMSSSWCDGLRRSLAWLGVCGAAGSQPLRFLPRSLLSFRFLPAPPPPPAAMASALRVAALAVRFLNFFCLLSSTKRATAGSLNLRFRRRPPPPPSQPASAPCCSTFITRIGRPNTSAPQRASAPFTCFRSLKSTNAKPLHVLEALSLTMRTAWTSPAEASAALMSASPTLVGRFPTNTLLLRSMFCSRDASPTPSARSRWRASASWPWILRHTACTTSGESTTT
mmetsp:Transcript_32127/g.85336  ORF Transcript_32127/g.85336 Transcript_32127/m.85336 type:complete len:348 (+) Transcript_32127:1396-2439(+)